MPETRWMVTTGEYSDYSVVAVFDDEEFARWYAKESNGEYESYRVETVDWWRSDEPRPRRVTVFTRRYAREWDAPAFSTWDSASSWWDHHLGELGNGKPKATEHGPDQPYALAAYWSLTVQGTNEEAVHKAFADRLAPFRRALEVKAVSEEPQTVFLEQL